MQHWARLYETEKNVATIHRKAADYIQRLGEEFENPKHEGLGAALTVNVEQPICARFVTPISEARIRLEWRWLAEFDITGLLAIERKLHDDRDQEVWRRVYEIFVPRGGRPYIGEQDSPAQWELGGVPARTSDEEYHVAAINVFYHATRGIEV